jgi:hypothetical protein
MMKATTKDLEELLEAAKARGLTGRFWDPKKRWLLLSLPEDKPAAVDTAQDGECPPPQK